MAHLEKREDENVSQFTIRRLRADFLEDIRSRTVAIDPDTSAIADEHRVGFLSGHKKALAEVFTMITEAMNE